MSETFFFTMWWKGLVGNGPEKLPNSTQRNFCEALVPFATFQNKFPYASSKCPSFEGKLPRPFKCEVPRPVLHTAKPINIMCVIFNLMECTMTDRPISDDLSKCWRAKLFGWIQKINVPAISVDSSQHVGCSICQLIQNHSSHQQIFTRKQGFGKRNLKGLLAFGNHS